MYDGRLQALREEMKRRKVDLYMLTTDDENFSGSIAPDPYWRSIEWLTGFSCSFGYMLITEEKVTFWTDSRYFSQAKRRIRLSGVELFDVTVCSADYYLTWIHDTLSEMKKTELVFGADGRTFTGQRADTIRKVLESVEGKRVLWDGGKDLVGGLWSDRPEPSYPELFELDIRYAGVGRAQKLTELRRTLRELGCTAYLSGTMDTVAWMTNLRGRSATTPMFPAYLLVSEKEAGLFCKEGTVGDELAERLRRDGIGLFDLSRIYEAVSGIDGTETVFFDRLNDAVVQSLPPAVRRVGGRDPVSGMKAVKNPAEIQCFREANLADSAVLVRVIKNLKEQAAVRRFHELDFTEQFERLRSQSPLYLCSGGPTVLAAYMENAASPHYFPGPEQNSEVKPQGVLLFDTGANFYGATTDISRTVYLGPCQYDEELRRDYTLSLKALIALARQIFRKGADGAYLDSVARCVMWNARMQYSYGTGHGIGACLNCHEGPEIIAEPSYKKEWASSDVPVVPGMILSNEPGVYKVGKYGIRLENDQLVTEDSKNEFGEFYRFETLSYCPFEPELIDETLLSDEELAWLNDYHEETFKRLSPLLNEEERGWLREQTKKIIR